MNGLVEVGNTVAAETPEPVDPTILESIVDIMNKWASVTKIHSMELFTASMSSEDVQKSLNHHRGSNDVKIVAQKIALMIENEHGTEKPSIFAKKPKV